MKGFYRSLLVAAALLLQTFTVSSQCLVRDSLIRIYPYFQKNDVLTYSLETLEMTIVAQDTTISKHQREVYQVACRKANDKNGYLLEETMLGYEDLVEYKDSLERIETVKRALREDLQQSMSGLKVGFSIDPLGKNLTVENPDKVLAEILQRVSASYDSFIGRYPVMGTLLSKESLTSIYKNMTGTPGQLLNEFEEMVKLFELHGNVYDYEVVKTIPMLGPEYTRPGEMMCVALDVPYEGCAKQDFDGYKFIIEGETYQDAATATATKLSRTYGREITREQLTELMGDKMPSGEIVSNETLENEYFYDGWPKELYHRIVSCSSAATVIEIQYIVCEERNTKR